MRTVYKISLILMMAVIAGACQSTSPIPIVEHQPAQAADHAGNTPSAGGAVPAETTAASSTRIMTFTPSAASAPVNETSSDVWLRRDVPPIDVIKQIDFVQPGGAGGGGSPCDASHGTSSKVVLEKQFQGAVEIYRKEIICGYGFRDNELVEVTIQRPDQTKLVYNQIANSHNFDPYVEIEIFPQPDDPVGSYSVSASGQSGTADTDYEVILASHPSGGKYDYRSGWGNPYDAKLGDPINLNLAGFPPNQEVRFHLFQQIRQEELPMGGNQCYGGCTKYTLEYLTTWKSASNGRGELSSAILTNLDTPRGSYLVLVEGPNASACDIDGPSFSNFGFDWGSMKCDLAFLVNVAFADVEVSRPLSLSQEPQSLWTLSHFQDMSKPDTKTYAIEVHSSSDWTWDFAWCAENADRLQEILKPLSVEFLVNGRRVPDLYIVIDQRQPQMGLECQYWTTQLHFYLQDSETQLDVHYHLSESVFDGSQSYEPGEYHQVLNVSTK